MKKRLKMGFIAKKGTKTLPLARGRLQTPLPSQDFGGHEYYLLHNAGAENRVLFSSQEDFDRFEAYLYLLNSTESPRAANFFAHGRERSIFETGRGDTLVAIGAYSFTPKEFHILVTAVAEKGIAKFMQKVQTAYTMYFNKKYAHEGRLFRSAYRAEAAQSDAHLKYLFARTHLAPAVIFESEWETFLSKDSTLARNALHYRYSSMAEYAAKKFRILSPELFPKYLLRVHDAGAHVRAWSKYRG